MVELEDGILANITKECKAVHEQNKKKGFWDKPRETGTMLMFIVSELAEALEADRAGNRRARIRNFILEREFIGYDFKDAFESQIKDTFEDELADAVIRIMDLCGAMDIDLGFHINAKLKYNATRPHKHGKQY